MKSSLLLFLLVFVPSALTAQQGGSVAMRIDVVAWGDSIAGLSLKSAKTGTFTARAFTYSEPISYSGPQLLEIHQTGSGEVSEAPVAGTPEDKDHESIPLQIEDDRGGAEDDTPISKELARRREEDPTLVALVRLPSNSRRATVLLAPSGQGTYRGYVINDDPAKLPLGKLRVHNLSSLPIAMRFTGDQQKELEPGESFLVDVKGGQVIYQLAYKRGEEWVVQENNIIPVRPDEQTQMIILRSRNQYFLSADGASGGFLQMVTLRRWKED